MQCVDIMRANAQAVGGDGMRTISQVVRDKGASSSVILKKEYREIGKSKDIFINLWSSKR